MDVALWTGIPVYKTEGENKVTSTEKSKRVIGQLLLKHC